MALLGLIGIILVVVAVYLASMTLVSLAAWVAVLFAGVVLVAISLGRGPYI
jgi:uncharacterized protein (DUF983 family)